jgi:hypothetical protein
MPPLVGRKRVQNWPALMTERHWTRHSNYSCVNDWWRVRFSHDCRSVDSDTRSRAENSAVRFFPATTAAITEGGGWGPRTGGVTASPTGRGRLPHERDWRVRCLCVHCSREWQPRSRRPDRRVPRRTVPRVHPPEQCDVVVVRASDAAGPHSEAHRGQTRRQCSDSGRNSRHRDASSRSPRVAARLRA